MDNQPSGSRMISFGNRAASLAGVDWPICLAGVASFAGRLDLVRRSV